MAVFYTNERARYGGVSGSIIPFPIKLPDTNVPNLGDWAKLLPAGFLRCDGSILNAGEYPVLAGVLGTGNNSKFRRSDQELTNDQFVLPDIGSKFVQGGNASGAYLNDKIVNDEDLEGTYRVGCEVNVTSLVGDTATISYEGYFEVTATGGPYNFIGNPTFGTTTSDGASLPSFLGDQAWQSHGHESKVGVFTYLGNWTDSTFTSVASQGGNDGQNEGSNELVTIDTPTESSAVVSHSHLIDFPTTQQIKDNNSLAYSFLNTQIDAFGLETTVNLTTSQVKKLDEATPPYILVEYIIKI